MMIVPMEDDDETHRNGDHLQPPTKQINILLALFMRLAAFWLGYMKCIQTLNLSLSANINNSNGVL